MNMLFCIKILMHHELLAVHVARTPAGAWRCCGRLGAQQRQVAVAEGQSEMLFQWLLLYRDGKTPLHGLALCLLHHLAR
jgi:hypothetical protein